MSAQRDRRNATHGGAGVGIAIGVAAAVRIAVGVGTATTAGEPSGPHQR